MADEYPTITSAEFQANPAAAFARAKHEGDIVIIGKDGEQRAVLHWSGPCPCDECVAIVTAKTEANDLIEYERLKAKYEKDESK